MCDQGKDKVRKIFSLWFISTRVFTELPHPSQSHPLIGAILVLEVFTLGAEKWSFRLRAENLWCVALFCMQN